MNFLEIKKRYILLLLIDSLIVTFSIFVGYYLLSPFHLEYTTSELIFSSLILLISHHLFAYIFNLYHRAWEYASVRELLSIFKAVTSSIISTYIINLLLLNTSFTRLMIITWMLHLILIGGSRLSWRILKNRINYKNKKSNKLRTTLIVGAGRGGSLLIRQLLEIPAMGMKPIVAVDDDPSKYKMELAGGIKVEGDRNDIKRLVEKYDIDKVAIAIPSLSKTELNKIYNIADDCNIDVFIMPNVDDVLAGKLEVSKLKKVEVEDLLGREPVILDTEGIKEEIEGRKILVTGAGGSIGSEIVRQISKFNPSKVLLLGHGENSIYLILEEMNLLNNNTTYVPIIADVQDRIRIENIFSQYKPDIIYHAAAHKHVPLMEFNPEEAVKNNIYGSKNVAEMAIKYKAKKFVMVSTDKAVNPPNVMGASKRIAEMFIQSLDSISNNTTLVAVRFGNVLGSRGSVIPKFKSQIERGGPITVTDERMTRYFMTIPEASRLVIQAGTLSKGGEIFVLDMGEPVRITDLAKNMIRLSGFNEQEIEIEYTGIRPGEKLYEELLSQEEIHPDQIYEKIYIGKSRVIDYEELTQELDELSKNISKEKILNFVKKYNEK